MKDENISWVDWLWLLQKHFDDLCWLLPGSDHFFCNGLHVRKRGPLKRTDKFSTERLLSELCWLCYTQIFAGNTIHKNDLHQKWNKRLNDISKIKRLWRTLCHRASWLVRTGSLRKESDRRLQRNEKLWLMLLLNCWPRNFVNKQIWWVTFTCHFSVWAILFWLLPTFSSKSRC